LEQCPEHSIGKVHVHRYSFFYLAAKLEYFEYMTIPFALFADWIIEQYDLKQHALNGKVHLELRRAMWGLTQAGILANKQFRWKLAAF
jgi:hypothetical protein